MSVNAYLFFNGNCREALVFYEKSFNTEKARIMTYGEMPENPGQALSEEAKNRVLHATLTINGTVIMFSDVPAGVPFKAGKNIELVVVSKNEGEIKSYFDKVKEGGSVTMELQKTFWSKCYGMVTDQFGIGWQFSLDSGEMGT